MTFQLRNELLLSEGIDFASGNDLSKLNETLSFLLEVLFSKRPSRAEVRIARAIFQPFAHVVLVPRGRALLARAMSIDEFLHCYRDRIKCDNVWTETMRVQEISESSGDALASSLLVHALVVIDPERASTHSRNADVLFVVGTVAATRCIRSCTVVYDERNSFARSPIALC